MRTIIIGDIHGCFATLKALFEKVNADPENDRILFVGDYIDRGPEVYHTLEFVSTLHDEHPENVILIRGNHEEMMIHRADNWDRNGNEFTRSDVRSHGSSVSEWIRYFKNNSVYYYTDENFQCCHALVEQEPIEENDIHTLIWGRPDNVGNSYDGRLTIAGHTPIEVPTLLKKRAGTVTEWEFTEYEFDKVYPLPEKGVMDIDTSCVYGGQLTAMIIEGKTMRFVSEKK